MNLTNPRDHTTETGFKKTWSVRPWHGQRCLGSKICLKKKNEKNPVCETLVWSLADQVKNLIEKK